METGERASGPAMAVSCRARSRTVRDMGPCTASVVHASAAGHVGTRPAEGRKPATLQKLAGWRSDPPRSLPSAIGTMPHVSATAAPPLLPPQVLLVSQGLRVAPNTGLKVCEPAASCGRLVLPRGIAPPRLR